MIDIVERLQRKVFRGPTMEAVHTKTLEWEAADTITRLTAEVEQNAIDLEEYRRDVERLRAALLVARNYVLVQSCELSLQPEDAARDLDVIDEALEEDDNG
jgi:hypothetical protein